MADRTPDAGIDYPIFRVTELLDVTVPLPATHVEVTLAETESPFRTVTFPIALPEGAAVVAARDKLEAPRPLTHELFSSVLRRFSIDVVALRITSRVDGVLFAELDLMGTRGREIVPCRPSDGIIVCLRQPVVAPILVAEGVFESR